MSPAIAVHHTATSDKDWDGPANVAKLKSDQSRAYYSKVFAWRDPDGDETVKSSYKFPHHEVSDEGMPGAANMNACSAGMAVLNGGRGGADIPEADRVGVHRHLAAHMMDGDMEPPELNSREMPKPEKGQTHDDFMEMCMGHDVMMEEFPDEKQRLKVCQEKWDKMYEEDSAGTEIERRNFDVSEIRVEAEDEKKPVIRGYAAVFNKLSLELFGFKEQIAPGAFQKTIAKSDVRALFNHDPNYVLGRTRSKTLSLEEDDKGLSIEIDPPDTQWARDLLASIKRGDISQMSFGFRVPKGGERWDEEEGKLPVRTLVEVELFDVSPVTFPAYPQTSVKVRDYLKSLRAETELDGTSARDDGRADRLAKQRLNYGYPK